MAAPRSPEGEPAARAARRPSSSGPAAPTSGGAAGDRRCARNTDCGNTLYGQCELVPGGGSFDYRTVCTPGCATDGDCAAGSVCHCESPVGRCIRAVDCAIDADCPAGALCASFIDRTTSCSTGIVGVACQKPSDGCVGDDCPLCTESATAGHRICEQASVGGCASF